MSGVGAMSPGCFPRPGRHRQSYSHQDTTHSTDKNILGKITTKIAPYTFTDSQSQQQSVQSEHMEML